MKASELRSKSAAELSKELGEMLRAGCALRMRLGTQQSGNTAELRKLRRDVARVRTVIREKAGS
jgi:large subunit ribosomal protein L29